MTASSATTAPSPPPEDGSYPLGLEIGVIRGALEPDYEILEELGRGGMAIVYRARERALDREVAIKILPAMLALDEAFVERFQREARTAGQLEHPNIVPIYRVGRAGHVIYFVMKLLRGQSLSGILRERGRLPAADVRRILLETTSALGYAAKRGVVHRDIKPDNILLDSEGRCIITDFGIAKTSSGPRTAAGTSMGTPRYMSPEHGQGSPVDGRSDVYSLGVVAYELLSGKLPFDGEDPFAVLYKHINSPVPRPELTTEEEWALYAVIERMLAKKPDERYQTSDELIQALGGDVSSTTLINVLGRPLAVATAPTEIIVTGPVTRLKRLAATRWPVIAAGVVVLAVGGYFATRSTPTAPAPSTRAPAPAGQVAATPAGAVVNAATAASPPGATTTQTKSPAVTPLPPVKEAFSRCPKPGAKNAVKPGDFRLLVDSNIRLREGSRLTVNYDVCGLDKNAPFQAEIKIEALGRGFLKRTFGGSIAPVAVDFLGAVDGPRTRLKYVMDTRQLKPGDYSLSVSITDAKKRRQEWSKQIRILEKAPAR